jgi:predicted Zn-dependent protease with MMP-like domain
MARPKKTAAAPAPIPPSRRSVNQTNKGIRRGQVMKTFGTNTNKINHPKVKLDALLKKDDLKAMGWKDREITQLRRYAILQNEFNNISRAYDDTIKNLKANNTEVIKKLDQLSGNSVLLNESLLINVTLKKNPSQGIKGEALAERLQEKFGDVLSQYNIDLEAILEEMKEEAAANVKTHNALLIGRQDYSQQFQSFRRNRRNSLREFETPDWLKLAWNSFLDFFGEISKYLKSLFEEKQELESIMIQMISLEENVKGNIKPYAKLYEKTRFR